MAIAVVGTGTTISVSTAHSIPSAPFTPLSRYVRLTCTCDTHVAIGTNPTASSTTLLIPGGTSETLSISNASGRVTGITTGNPTLIDFAQGTQSPFGVGDFVTMTEGNSYYTTNIVNKHVRTVFTGSGSGGYFSSRIAVDFDSGTSGAPLQFDPNGRLLRASLKIAARGRAGQNAGTAGTCFIQQVNVTGQA